MSVMNINKINSHFYFISLGVFFLLLLVNVINITLSNGLNNEGCGLVINTSFSLDLLGVVMGLLSWFIGFSIILFFNNSLNYNTFFIFSSILCSFICFLSYNCLVFWVFYELSILFLLFMLYSDSPYSERFLAGWYLMAYGFFSGVPMLVVLVNNSLLNGSFNYNTWTSINCDWLLFILFISKIPLLPFHVWLPIVHAEASSVTSVCLSGYIMKLGIVGVLRFCSDVINSNLIFLYLCCSLIFAIFIFVSSIEENDFKRWLAMLSLCHIVVGVICLCSNNVISESSSLYFGLGHGLSASYFFLLIMFLGILGGSRLTSGISLTNSWSFCFNWSFLLGFCYVASFPPILNFFIEVWLIGVYSSSWGIYLLLLVYLFLEA
uniref:NADH-ubiquinone oxidoreductase chain 4 n=1 Tax=Pseudochauhanea macrorchis TaxID=1086615 RepID=H6U4R6_PSEMH|nr:NADH dehydrogenase subunit 4 [Pseudochauhanea macrorchis]AEO93252.1 NADH dehydrogenase subunit 4 [Pseudochauhanea macrorchis]